LLHFCLSQADGKDAMSKHRLILRSHWKWVLLALAVLAGILYFVNIFRVLFHNGSLPSGYELLSYHIDILGGSYPSLFRYYDIFTLVLIFTPLAALATVLALFLPPLGVRLVAIFSAISTAGSLSLLVLSLTGYVILHQFTHLWSRSLGTMPAAILELGVLVLAILMLKSWKR
jgi:hypothetical protein